MARKPKAPEPPKDDRCCGNCRHWKRTGETGEEARLLGLLVASGREELFRVADRSRDALFRKALGRLKIEDLHFHDARGEALTRLSRKVDILTLQRISGHIDINQLSAYYRETPADIAKRL